MCLFFLLYLLFGSYNNEGQCRSIRYSEINYSKPGRQTATSLLQIICWLGTQICWFCSFQCNYIGSFARTVMSSFRYLIKGEKTSEWVSLNISLKLLLPNGTFCLWTYFKMILNCIVHKEHNTYRLWILILNLKIWKLVWKGLF